MLNLLQQIQDDPSAMRHVYRISKPDGIAVIEVPAGLRLYDVCDRWLLHCRRYSLSTLRVLVKSIGFQIIKQSHLGFSFCPGLWLIEQRNERFLCQERPVDQQITTQNIRDTRGRRWLDTVIRIELALDRWVSYPFGIRCLMSCLKTL